MSTGQHVPPRPGKAHDWQGPVHATLQHAPSAQKPDAHSPFTLQLEPFIFLPQLPLTQGLPLTHWLACVHESKQAPIFVSHAYGAQMIVGAG